MKSLLLDVLDASPMNHQGEPRRMGVEIELAGIEPNRLAQLVQQFFGGEIVWQSPFEIVINNSDFGEFKLELDSEQIKEIGENSNIDGDPHQEPKSFERSYIELVSDLAVNLVPWEIVTPPISFKDLPKLYPLVDALREEGAKGTREAPHYAFGVHLNPELPNHDPGTITKFLQSYCCLYDWVREVEQTDLMRRVTPYINHYDTKYLKLITAQHYSPKLDTLIDDYLLHNPSRNRSLDMLPLFKFLNSEKVLNAIDDQRVNARPTFHYRLPNCDIGNQNWNLDLSIEMWMAIESLAMHESLDGLVHEFNADLEKLISSSGKSWAKVVENHLSTHELLPKVAKDYVRNMS